MQKTGKSLYLHIPFCTHKCPYCHFYVVPYREDFEKKLLKGLEQEWHLYSPRFGNEDLVSIYFGGGTPSLLDPSSIKQLLDIIGLPAQEITLEVNPETVTLAKMEGFRKAGINRVSLGVQSLDDSELSLLDRRHSAQKAIEAINTVVEAGITNISIDLMFELPGQTMISWRRTLERAKSLPITHLSLYNLTFEPHTPFFKRQKEFKAILPSDETRLNMLNLAVETLEKAGLERYEISAFAKPGYQSLHNTGYWLARPFIGLGPSAFSYWDGKRFQNACSLQHWAQALEENKFPVDFEEKLAPSAAFNELLAVQLRMTCGVNLDEFCARHGPTPDETQEALCRLIEKKWLSPEGSHIRLTEAGRLFYDSLASEII